MPIDREGTLRKADKLVRQGKVDQAIAEYRSLIEDQPTDWNTANILGDLYVRAGRVEQAVGEYGRIADHLADEGFFPKAIALYRKILKIKPDEELTMMRLGRILGRQGLLVEARAQFGSVADRRRARGDRRGEAEATAQLGDLEGADIAARTAGARAFVELGDTRAGVERLKQIAAVLEEENRTTESVELLREAAALAPEDPDLRGSLAGAYSPRVGEEPVGQHTNTPSELKEMADQLFLQGRNSEAVTALSLAVEADPGDVDARLRVVRILTTNGDREAARRMLTPESVRASPELKWILAELELREGHITEGAALFQQILERDPKRRNQLVRLGCTMSDSSPTAAFECVDVAARAAIRQDDWPSAAACFSEFATRTTNNVPALMRLVEICVDGGLEAAMVSAQVQLADAYLAIGAGTEARIIAEDLVAREPWEHANIERFRRALALLGEEDADAIIAERLGGQSPFVSRDIVRVPSAGHTADAGGARGATGEKEERAAVPEIDLSDVIQDLKRPAAPARAPDSIERVLKTMRDELAREPATPEAAEQHMKLATACLDAGSVDEAMQALEVASRSVRHRFRAAAILAKLHKDRGNTAQAVEWLERAAEAPAPSADASHQLLYELATALEAQGESARALAVFLELQAEAGNYRDLAARLEHLTKVC